jgi:serine protease Do
LPAVNANLASVCIMQRVFNVLLLAGLLGLPSSLFSEDIPAGVAKLREFSDALARAAQIARNASCRVGSGGSGTIITEDGLIVTNNHVVGQNKTIQVTVYATGQKLAGRVICNAPRDIALVKIDGSFPFHAKLGNSDRMEVGDWVLACGMPQYLTETLTEGIITNKTRGSGERRWSKFLWTNASQNPGNSGGGLFNLNGELVGVNGTINNYFVCIATPIEYVRRLMTHFQGTYDYVGAHQLQRGEIGAKFSTLSAAAARQRGAVIKHGVLISEVVAGGPAHRAGLQVGDIVTQFNEFEVDDEHVFEAQVRYTKPGTAVVLTIIRNGSPQTLNVRIGEKTTP